MSAMNLAEVELTSLLPCSVLSHVVYALSVCLLEPMCELDGWCTGPMSDESGFPSSLCGHDDPCAELV